jgi:hypothetical protein
MDAFFFKLLKSTIKLGLSNILIIKGQTIIILIFSMHQKKLWLLVIFFDIYQWTHHFTLLSPNYIFNGRTFYNLKITITICKIKFIMRHQFAWRDQNLTHILYILANQKILNFTKITTISHMIIDKLYYYNCYMFNSNKNQKIILKYEDHSCPAYDHS